MQNVANPKNITYAVNTLRENAKGQFWVFAQRYDGIDLPDAACRLLVIDGLPQGEGLIDRVDSELAGGVIGMRGKIANRVEQGLGRAVRSSSDYCAVLLAGRDLANFVSRRIVLENFSPLTVRQIEIGKEVSAAISENNNKPQAVADTVKQCLSRDASWRSYYAAQIALPPENVADLLQNAARNRDVAVAERDALKLGIARDYASASTVLQHAANMVRDDRMARGVLKQAAARDLYMVDPVAAMDLQSSAYSDNMQASRPPVQASKLSRRVTTQSESIAVWLKGFADKSGALVAIDQLRAKLAFSNGASVVEAAVEELGVLLGAESSRPEKQYGRGPDNLWLFDDVAYCIEMKSDKVSHLSKSDAGQLALSVQWAEQNCPSGVAVKAIIGSDVSSADVMKDFPLESIVVGQAAFLEMLDRLRKLVVALISQGPLFSEEPANVQRQFGPLGLLPSQLLQGCGGVKQG